MNARGPESGRRVSGRAVNAKLFWSKVQKAMGCWTWIGYTPPTGYGSMNVPGMKGPVPAHRISYALKHGSCPPGMVVMHTCDNKLCVNPKHLRAGTQGDNFRDAVRKGRVRWERPTKCRSCDHPPAPQSYWCEWHYAEAQAHRFEKKRNKTLTKRSVGADTPGFDFPWLVKQYGERRATIFAQNHGLFGFTPPRKCAALAKQYGVSRERVRQIVSRIGKAVGFERATFWGAGKSDSTPTARATDETARFWETYPWEAR